MTQSQPPITRTTHTLPFDKLSPRDFERLCLWLVEREGYERAEHLGAAGSEQGRDIVAWREGARWAFQCKRVRRFGPKDALAEVEKVLGLPEAERPVGLVFLVTCDVSANTRQQARERCTGEMKCHFWAGTELDEKVKRHSDIMEEFFADIQVRAETTVTATVSHVTDSTVITAGRDIIIYNKGAKPVSAGDLLEACQAQVKSVLYDVRYKYDPKLYVNRAIERDLNDFFDSPFDGLAPHCFLIVAPAGSGKTNLLCELARVRIARQPVLLLMGGNLYISATSGLLGAIQSELQAANPKIHLRVAEDSLHALDRLAEEMGRDVLLILDAINEYDTPAQMRKAVEDLLRKTGGKRIKLVVTCRDYYWGLFKGSFWEGATVNDLPTEADEDEIGDTEEDFRRFAADEHERALPLYLDHYHITGQVVGDAAERCRHPLLLRFFCEAYRGQDVEWIEDIRLKELFDLYWDQKLDSIAERMFKSGDERRHDALAAEVGDYLLTIAAYMLRHHVRAIPLAQMPQVTGREEPHGDPCSTFGRIRDEFIILEEKHRGKGRWKVVQVAFVYEEFMEYVMARSLMRDWADWGLHMILSNIEDLTYKYRSFIQITGVMVYLAQMLKEERNLTLWSQLLNKGAHWRKVIFEAIRKLPEDKLDADVFYALGEMFDTGDRRIQLQVLDTLRVKRVGCKAPVIMVDALGRIAVDAPRAIARRALLALGNMKASPALPTLIQALGDPLSSVREDAIVSLKKMGYAQAVEHSNASSHERARHARLWAIDLLGKQEDTALEPLVALLEDGDWLVQQGAAKVLGELGDVRGVEFLTAALKDSNEKVRRGAIRGLGQIWKLPSLTQLGSSDGNERTGAAETLGLLGDARAVEPLIAILRDGDERVRSEAAEALELLGDVAVEPLITALKYNDECVQARAAQVLRCIGMPEALAAVREYEAQKKR